MNEIAVHSQQQLDLPADHEPATVQLAKWAVAADAAHRGARPAQAMPIAAARCRSLFAGPPRISGADPGWPRMACRLLAACIGMPVVIVCPPEAA